MVATAYDTRQTLSVGQYKDGLCAQAARVVSSTRSVASAAISSGIASEETEGALATARDRGLRR